MLAVSVADAVRRGLDAAVTGADPGLATADSLCRACVELLQVDGAAISLVHQGQSRGTFGSSSEFSRRLDAYQFTYGEGPCLDASRSAVPVLVADLDDLSEQRWPVFSASVQSFGVRAVFALPVSVAATTVGALDLFRRVPGALSPDALDGALLAAHLAALPVLDLMTKVVRMTADQDEATVLVQDWRELESLERTEVYQATGILIAQGDLGPADALVRLRARAFTTGQTASEVAWEIVEGALALDADGGWCRPGEGSPWQRGPR